MLVDSEALSWQSWCEVLARYGYEPTGEDHEAALGRTLPVLYDYFARRVRLPGLEALADEVTTHTLELFDRHLQVFPDGVAMAEKLRAQGVRLAVASSSSTRRLHHTLATCDLERLFEVVVAGDEVDHGKPAPDLYREAARRLGIPAGACVAIEDSPAGFASAQAARMRVVAVVRPHTTREALKAADVVVDALTEDVLPA